MLEINRTGVPVTDRGPQMSMPNGRWFHPLNPSADEVFIEDIAQSLSHTVRYNGLSDRPINVAHHSCNASWLAEKENHGSRVQLAMLMHDAPEYVVGDLIRPIKMELPEFSVIEERVMVVINKRFNLPIIDHDLIKHFDNLALAWEKRDMFNNARPWPGLPDVPECCPIMITWTAQYAECRFLHLFHWLMEDIQFVNSDG